MEINNFNGFSNDANSCHYIELSSINFMGNNSSQKKRKDLCNVTLFYPDISMYEKTNWNAFKNKDLGEFMKQKRKYTLQPKTFYQKMKYMVFL